MTDEARRKGGDRPPELDREDEEILARIHDEEGRRNPPAYLKKKDGGGPARGPREPYTPPSRR